MATKKVKKFGRGGDILTGIGAGLAGYGIYKALTKDKDDDYTRRVKEYGTKGRFPEERTEEKAKPEEDKKGPIAKSDERFPEATEQADVRDKSDSGKSPKPEASKVYKAEPGKGFAAPVKAIKPASAKPKVDLAKQKVGVGYEKLGVAPEKKAGASSEKSKEYPVKNYVSNEDRKSKTSPMFVREVADKNASTALPKGIDLKGTNKTVYGTDTTSVFQKKAEQERKEKEEAAARKKKEAAEAKEFRDRPLQPMKKGGAVKKYASGGSVKASKMGSVRTAKPTMRSASARADGIAIRGKTRA